MSKFVISNMLKRVLVSSVTSGVGYSLFRNGNQIIDGIENKFKKKITKKLINYTISKLVIPNLFNIVLFGSVIAGIGYYIYRNQYQNRDAIINQIKEDHYREVQQLKDELIIIQHSTIQEY